MIDYEVLIEVYCNVCHIKLEDDKDNINILCGKCWEEIPLKKLMDIMKDILNEKEWETYDGIGFKDSEDKKTFMKGIRYGIEHAFFELALNYGGDKGIDLFEEISGWKKL